MNYRIRHTTTYSYSDPVPVCHNQVLLSPRESSWLECHSHRLQVRPAPTIAGRRRDYFGNLVHVFSIEESLKKLTITSTSRVTVTPRELPSSCSTLPWERLVAAVSNRKDANWMEACEFTFDSPFIRRGDDFVNYAETSFTPGRPILEATLELTERINSEFKYDTAATHVNTTPEEAFRLKAGVCQDFAHVQIACLRSLGIPAKYVSGYLRTIPKPGEKRLVGADESHAWIAVYCGAASGDLGPGWVDVDPTNNCICSTDHIPVATGRDYQDVAPIRGVFIGGGTHELDVSVDVCPTEPEDAGT